MYKTLAIVLWVLWVIVSAVQISTAKIQVEIGESWLAFFTIISATFAATVGFLFLVSAGIPITVPVILATIVIESLTFIVLDEWASD